MSKKDEEKQIGRGRPHQPCRPLRTWDIVTYSSSTSEILSSGKSLLWPYTSQPSSKITTFLVLFNFPGTLKALNNVCRMRDSTVPFLPAALPNGSPHPRPATGWHPRPGDSCGCPHLAYSASSVFIPSPVRQYKVVKGEWCWQSDCWGVRLYNSLAQGFPASSSSIKQEWQEYPPPRVVVRVTGGLARAKCSGYLN